MSKYQSTVDIAKALNLSPSIVSRTLNDEKGTFQSVQHLVNVECRKIVVTSGMLETI